jgi:hypothetical protein
MKLGWLYKRYDDDAEWSFSETEPDRWCFAKRQIVYAEIIE